MNIKFEQGWMHLGKERSLRLTDAQGTKVVVRSGSLWLTQDRDLNDHVLEAGQAFSLDRAGDAILFSLTPSEFELIEPPEAASKVVNAQSKLAGAADAAGRWISQRFGPEAICNRQLRYWGDAI